MRPPVAVRNPVPGVTLPAGCTHSVLASFNNQDLLLMLSTPGVDAKPPAFAVIKLETSLVVEVALFHLKVTLKQKGQVINILLKPDDELRESLAAQPPPVDVELVLVVPTHMQRETVGDVDGMLRIQLLEAEQDIPIVAMKSPAKVL